MPLRLDYTNMMASAIHDGISDAWEISYAESTNLFTATSDTDGDGVSDLNEYRADTSPMDATDKLDILDFIRGSTASTLTWTSRPARLYRIGQSTDLAAWLRSDSFAPDAGDSTTRLTRHDPGPRRFFKVEAVLPLQN